MPTISQPVAIRSRRTSLTNPGGATPIVPSLSVAFSPTLQPVTPVTPAMDSAVTLSPVHPASVAAALSSPVGGLATLCAPRLIFSLRDLVLLHPPTTVMPRGTRFWCSQRPSLHRFHHLQAGCAEHFARLARYIAGKTVGLVLSGGGARGLAHMGVLQSFAEQGVPIDYIGGTSQGSFMSALYAGQALHSVDSLSQMRTRVHLMAERMGSIRTLLTDATFPIMSYFSGCRFGSNIAAILGPHTRLEDLWLPYFCVTTNLSLADMCVHVSGTLWSGRHTGSKRRRPGTICSPCGSSRSTRCCFSHLSPSPGKLFVVR